MAKPQLIQQVETIAPKAKTRIVALTKIIHGIAGPEDSLKTLVIAKDAELPWDPRDPSQSEEHGLEGLREGIHYQLTY